MAIAMGIFGSFMLVGGITGGMWVLAQRDRPGLGLQWAGCCLAIIAGVGYLIVALLGN